MLSPRGGGGGACNPYAMLDGSYVPVGWEFDNNNPPLGENI